MAVVSISRQFGAGGKTLGELVAGSLGYQFLHESQLDKLAQEAAKKMPAEGSHQSQYHKQVIELLTSIAPSNFMDRWTSKGGDDKAHIERLTHVIQELASEGNVVLLGRGSQFVLRHRPDTVRVLLVAELPHRIEFMVRNYEMDERTAKKLIHDADKKRARFLKNFYPGEPNESSLYHLALNTSVVPLGSATAQVYMLVKRFEQQLEDEALA